MKDLGSLPRGQWVAANAVTFGMDAIAPLIAHVLPRTGGRHVRAWLILFPMWVAMGVLVALTVTLPVSPGIIAATGAQNPATSNDMLRPWVFGVVYGGFGAEGLVLLAAFELYADERRGGLCVMSLGRRLELRRRGFAARHHAKITSKRLSRIGHEACWPGS
uniref:Uncharacterized protein n=1 Tax=Streptomyces sp. NBC_00003 TaxID=2903608 RepID=A0AAU2VFD5_9ACTN